MGIEMPGRREYPDVIEPCILKQAGTPCLQERIAI